MTVDFNAIVSAHAAAQQRVSIPVIPKTYKGWEISFDPPPIPVRNFDWVATSPDFDADCDQDGFFVCSGGQVHAATHEDLLREIDDWIAGNGDA